MSGEPWLILPTYNEAENVEAIVAAAGAVLARAAPDGFRVLVVDDGSPDGTGELADGLAASHDWVAVLHRSEKNGIGPAYLAGFRHALDHGAGYLMEMDSDFSHDPEAGAHGPIGELDLKGIALRADAVEVDRLEHLPAEALKAARQIVHGQAEHESRVGRAPLTDEAAQGAPVAHAPAGHITGAQR